MPGSTAGEESLQFAPHQLPQVSVVGGGPCSLGQLLHVRQVNVEDGDSHVHHHHGRHEAVEAVHELVHRGLETIRRETR